MLFKYKGRFYFFWLWFSFACCPFLSENTYCTSLALQHQLWNLAQRTTALPFGRGAFTLATTYTILTEVRIAFFL